MNMHGPAGLAGQVLCLLHVHVCAYARARLFRVLALGKKLIVIGLNGLIP